MARIRVNTPYHLGLSVRRLSESAFPALSMVRPIRNRYGCHTLASAGPSAILFLWVPNTTLLTRLMPITFQCLKIWHVNLLDNAHGGTAAETPVPAPDVEPYL